MLLYLPNGLIKRPPDTCDFTDLTGSTYTAPATWAPERGPDVLELSFAPDPSPAEQDAIRRRICTTGAEDEAHLYDLLAGVADPATPSWAKTLLNAELARYGEPYPGLPAPPVEVVP